MAKQEIQLEDLIGKVYFKIATWHNDAPDYNGEENKVRLYSVSYEIIKTVLTEIGVSMDEEEIEGAEKTEEDEKVEFSEKRLKEIAKALKDKGLI